MRELETLEQIIKDSKISLLPHHRSHFRYLSSLSIIKLGTVKSHTSHLRIYRNDLLMRLVADESHRDRESSTMSNTLGNTCHVDGYLYK